MKHIFYSLLAITLTAFTIKTHAQSADEIVKKHIAATGGIDNWRKLKTMVMIGTCSAKGLEFPVTTTIENKKAMRFEYTVNGKSGYYILTATNGWSYNPFAAPAKIQPMDDEDVKQGQDGLDLEGDIIDYQKKGNKIAYIGNEMINGAGCYKIQVIFPSGKTEVEYVDTLSYYVVRSVQNSTKNGKQSEQVTDFGKFTMLDAGVVEPMILTGGMGDMTLTSILINKPVDKKIFIPSGN